MAVSAAQLASTRLLRTLPAQLSKETRPWAELKSLPPFSPSRPVRVSFAADDDSTRSDVPLDRWRPITEKIDQMPAMGYQVWGIQGDDNLQKPEAIDPGGLWVKPSGIQRNPERTE
jgi:hypothetical protein